MKEFVECRSKIKLGATLDSGFVILSRKKTKQKEANRTSKMNVKQIRVTKQSQVMRQALAAGGN